jgi:hypothetical protein
VRTTPIATAPLYLPDEGGRGVNMNIPFIEIFVLLQFRHSGADWNLLQFEPGTSVSRAFPREDIKMWKSLTVSGLAGALVAVAMTPLLADEQFSAATIVNLPKGENLGAFDISFVEQGSHTYALSASRVVPSSGTGAFGEVVIVDTNTNLVTAELKSAAHPFAGAAAFFAFYSDPRLHRRNGHRDWP